MSASMEPQGLGCGVRRPNQDDSQDEGASMEPQGLGCGVDTLIREIKRMIKASMEPQGLGCGVAQRGPSTHPEIRCFNGATGFRLWSRSNRAQ